MKEEVLWRAVHAENEEVRKEQVGIGGRYLRKAGKG